MMIMMNNDGFVYGADGDNDDDDDDSDVDEMTIIKALHS